ncbi:MAG TPA: 50S ribosomal protein L32 [Enterococcus columbae]|nr:50S ribosomal protein L32 [Enterococcus columbae]
MAVPARKTSKSQKRKRRTHKKLATPSISFDLKSGTFKRSHHISLKEYKEKLKQQEEA